MSDVARQARIHSVADDLHRLLIEVLDRERSWDELRKHENEAYELLAWIRTGKGKKNR